jgi:hypothetical protein
MLNSATTSPRYIFLTLARKVMPVEWKCTDGKEEKSIELRVSRRRGNI